MYWMFQKEIYNILNISHDKIKQILNHVSRIMSIWLCMQNIKKEIGVLYKVSHIQKIKMLNVYIQVHSKIFDKEIWTQVNRSHLCTACIFMVSVNIVLVYKEKFPSFLISLLILNILKLYVLFNWETLISSSHIYTLLI